ncbi:MAG TPA: class II fructose-bisphosphatase [Chloroflexota bacterium]|nr:class II fructose-bisphosphatase [Chloroflexota bacterium]
MLAEERRTGTARPNLDRNLSFELARVTEAAALASARWMGKGDKIAADQAAVNAMRFALDSVDMDGIVVIGEGEKDEAPMLYTGERIGNGLPPETDIAVDPVDGTTLLSKGLPNSVSVVALAKRGTMLGWKGIAYMEKIAVGPAGKGHVSLDLSIEENLKALAAAKHVDVDDLTVVILERDRHNEIIRRVREAGARVKLITDGDIAGGIMPSMEETGMDMLLGIGGSPEAVTTACALKCLGGDIQCRYWPRNDKERDLAEQQNLPLGQILTIDDLVADDDVFFSLTGVTTGELVRGVRYTSNGAFTETLAMRGKSGTVRRVQSSHNFDKLMRYSALAYDQKPGNGNGGGGGA